MYKCRCECTLYSCSVYLLNEERAIYKCRCECTLYSCSVYLLNEESAMYKCRCECTLSASIGLANLLDSDAIQDIEKSGCSESSGFGYGICRVIDALVIDVQRANAVFAVPVCTCLMSSFRGAYHAAARWRKTGARCDRASRLARRAWRTRC